MKMTVQQYVAAHPYYSMASFRWILFGRHTNGLAKAGAVIKIGKKILIDPERVEAWENDQREVAA
jgi:hypothetical protein